MAEWSIAFDCKSNDLRSTKVRILPGAQNIKKFPTLRGIFLYVKQLAKKSLFLYSMGTMSQDHLIKLSNKETGEIIFTRKNKKQNPNKLEFKKFSKKLRKHVVFKEAKK